MVLLIHLRGGETMNSEKSSELIKALFEGYFAPVEVMTQNNPEYDAASKAMNVSEDKLRNTFSKEQEELFEEFHSDLLAQEDTLIVRAFGLGLKTAMLLQNELKDIPLGNIRDLLGQKE